MVRVPEFPTEAEPISRISSAEDISEPVKKRQRKADIGNHIQSRIEEIRTLLLEKNGVDVNNLTSDEVPQLLSKAYSPRLTDLIEELVVVADGLRTPSDTSDVSDDDAVVPLSESVDPVIAQKVPEPLPEVVAEPKRTAYKSETEIAISRIFDLGKVANVADQSIPVSAPYDGPSVISMTGFGELGRYGNQVLQYMFLKCYAARHNIEEIQVPGWVGASLFGLRDREVQRALPPATEYRETLANSTFTTDLLDYVKTSNTETEVVDLYPSVLGSDATDAPRNVDIWGWYQWHTSHFAPYKSLLQDTFTAVPEIRGELEKAFDMNVRNFGGERRTVVGLHMRLGDYKNISASSFGYCAPASWYLAWLKQIWPTLENPVLFVASDDLDAVLRDFASYNPITADNAGVKMPDAAKDLKAGFFPDWFCLTQCDVLAISNSTFSMSACMMNQRPNAQFHRAHYSGEIQKMDPWNADPIVHRDMNKRGISGLVETLQIVYKTQGSVGLAKNMLYELPYYGMRSAIMKAVLWKKAAKKLAVA